MDLCLLQLGSECTHIQGMTPQFKQLALAVAKKGITYFILKHKI